MLSSSFQEVWPSRKVFPGILQKNKKQQISLFMQLPNYKFIFPGVTEWFQTTKILQNLSVHVELECTQLTICKEEEEGNRAFQIYLSPEKWKFRSVYSSIYLVIQIHLYILRLLGKEWFYEYHKNSFDSITIVLQIYSLFRSKTNQK